MMLSMMAGFQNLSLSGALSTTSASSPVTSVSRTVRGFGKLLFGSITTDSGTPEYRLNAGAWTTITDPMTLTVAAGDTLEVRCSLASVGWICTFSCSQTFDGSTGSLIEPVVLTRS